MQDIQKMMQKIKLNSDYGPIYVTNKPFTRVDDAIVDGEQWICVSTRNNGEVARWLRKHDAVEVTTRWAFDAYFEMPEKLYIMMVLKFQ